MSFQDEGSPSDNFLNCSSETFLLSILTDTFNGFCDSDKISYRFVLHVAYVLIGLSRMTEIQF